MNLTTLSQELHQVEARQLITKPELIAFSERFWGEELTTMDADEVRRRIAIANQIMSQGVSELNRRDKQQMMDALRTISEKL